MKIKILYISHLSGVSLIWSLRLLLHLQNKHLYHIIC